MKPVLLSNILTEARSGFWGHEAGTVEVDALVIRNGDVQEDGLRWDALPLRGITQSEYERAQVRKGDIVLTTSGDCGFSAYITEEPESPTIASNFVRLLRFDERRIFPRYAFHLIHSDTFRRRLGPFIRGTTLKNLSLTNAVEAVDIPIPFPDDPRRSLAEQKRIAAILDRADAIRRRRQEAARLADTLSWSCFHWHFGDPAHSSCKHPRRPLEEVVSAVIDCPHSTPRWERNGVIALRTSNLGFGTWNWDDTRYVTEDEYVERSQRGELEAGDVVLSREGTVGVAAIVERGQRMCMGQRLVQVKPNPTALRSEVLLYLLLYSLAPDRISRLMAGSTSKHLNVKDLRQLPVILPPKPLQDKFAAELSAIRVIQTCHQHQHDDSALMFNSLVQRAFRGEL